MLEQILALTQDLIAIPSVNGNSQALQDVLKRALKELPNYTLERFESRGTPSVLVYNTPVRPKKFKLILNGHLDVVPGKPDQYRVVEKEGKLIGRGTDDMKAATAVLILLFQELASKLKYPLALQLVTDEEMGGFDGVKYQIQKGVLTDFFITGESTHLNLKNEAKGVVWARATAKGVTAHGAYPWRGENALWKLKPLMDALEKEFPVPKKETWQTTANLSFVSSGNQTYNKVPDEAALGMDIRYIPADSKSIIKKIESMTPKNVKLEFLEKEPFHYTDPDFEPLKSLKKIITKHTGKKVDIVRGHGASDARHYSEQGIAGVEFGPIGGGLHSDNEWVNLESLNAYYSILKDYLYAI